MLKRKISVDDKLIVYDNVESDKLPGKSDELRLKIRKQTILARKVQMGPEESHQRRGDYELGRNPNDYFRQMLLLSTKQFENDP